MSVISSFRIKDAGVDAFLANDMQCHGLTYYIACIDCSGEFLCSNLLSNRKKGSLQLLCFPGFS